MYIYCDVYDGNRLKGVGDFSRRTEFFILSICHQHLCKVGRQKQYTRRATVAYSLVVRGGLTGWMNFAVNNYL